MVRQTISRPEGTVDLRPAFQPCGRNSLLSQDGATNYESVPKGQQILAQRFSAGYASKKGPESRRDDTKMAADIAPPTFAGCLTYPFSSDEWDRRTWNSYQSFRNASRFNPRHSNRWNEGGTGPNRRVGSHQ